MELVVSIIVIYILYKLIRSISKKKKTNPSEDNSLSDMFEVKVSYGSSSKKDYSNPSMTSSQRTKVKQLKETISKLENNFTKLISKPIVQNLKIDYKKELNPMQLEAVTTTTGKTLVIAGAGSGKTKTLTFRTGYLLETKVNPNSILLLTFTKKAAKEIKSRVNQLLHSEQSNNITSGTFHSFCNMMLASYSKILNINPKFTILDQEDSRDLIDLIKKTNKFEKKEDIPFPKKATVQNIISMSRNKVIPIDKLIEKEFSNYKIYLDDIVKIAKLYSEYKKENSLYDYDDLIEEIVSHLKTNDVFRNKLQNRFKYIMVDEYQDTNIPQKELIDLLSQNEESSLMVVGDDNQSIYAFRGANYENILRFGETYPNAKLIKLEENYRSNERILNFVNSVSDNISLGYKKALYTKDKSKGNLPSFVRCSSDETEAKFIADTIVDSYNKRLKYSDMSVLCRASFQSNFVQAEFLKRNIPFTVVGGIKFIERRHVKDMLAYMKILWNPFDAISWHRILTILDGIGKVTANKITEAIKAEQGNLEPLQDSKFNRKNENLKLLFESLNSAKNKSSLVETFDEIEKYYIPILKKLEEDWKTRVEDFKVLKRLCVEYGNLEKFLSNLVLDPPNDSKATFVSNDQKDEDAVTITTIHSAKGLEWNTVFVVSLIDGAVPHYKSFDDYEQLEEERKLFYVAASRAKESLYLTSPMYVSTYSGFFDSITRFVNETDKSNYKYIELT